VLVRATEYTAVTHDRAEGIKGAQATAAAIFLARTGSAKEVGTNSTAGRRVIFQPNLNRESGQGVVAGPSRADGSRNRVCSRRLRS